MASTAARVFDSIAEYRRFRRELVGNEKRPLVGFVPTMGALHEGHAALMRKARESCQNVVVSIFVNPMQFGPNEDYARYPRTFDRDVELCRLEGVDAILHPSVEEIYPSPIAEITHVVPPERLVKRLCGLFRPGHFEGVATVVMKLFAIAQPEVAFFGEKDYQQLTIIKQMVSDLNLDMRIEGVPTVRESDGLALSSRNAYLTSDQRKLAPRLQATISRVKDQILQGKLAVDEAVASGKKQLSESGFDVQYLEVVDAETLSTLKQAFTPLVVLVAAKLGAVRLIDNVIAR